MLIFLCKLSNESAKDQKYSEIAIEKITKQQNRFSRRFEMRKSQSAWILKIH